MVFHSAGFPRIFGSRKHGFPARTDCQSAPTMSWLLRAFRDLREDPPIEHGKDQADEYLDN